MSFLSVVDRGNFHRAVFGIDFFDYGGVYERARRAVSLDKEVTSTLSSPRCMNGYRRQTGDGLASPPWGRVQYS